MYKVLIVDDELLIQVGVKSMIDKGTDVQVIGVASNGKNALEIMENDFPDIIITDVKMPVMDGIELIENIKNKYKNPPVFIILTSYEDFDMARKAIKYNVKEYLIKIELTSEVLNSAIKNAICEVKNLRENNNYKDKSNDEKELLGNLKERFFIKLLYNLFDDKKQLELYLKQLNLNFENKDYVTCFCSMEINNKSNDFEKLIDTYMISFNMVKQISGKYLECYNIFLDTNNFAIIICFSKEDKEDREDNINKAIDNINESINKYFNVSLRVGVGLIYEDLINVSLSFEEARNKFNLLEIKERIGFYSRKELNGGINDINMLSFNEEIRKSFEEYNIERLYNTFEKLIYIIEENNYDYLKSMDLACNILYISLNLLNDGEDFINSIFNNEVDGYRNIYKKRNVAEIIQWLISLRDNLCMYIETRKNNYKHHIVTQVKKYINDNLEKKVSLHETANLHNISSSYLSLIFKKDCNIGFSEYANLMKINKAKELLTKENYKVYEVADILGFESAFYFSKVFKKITGYSPKDYLNNRA